MRNDWRTPLWGRAMAANTPALIQRRTVLVSTRNRSATSFTVKISDSDIDIPFFCLLNISIQMYIYRESRKKRKKGPLYAASWQLLPCVTRTHTVHHDELMRFSCVHL